MAELRSLRKDGEPLDVYAISKDSPADSKRFAEKIASDGKGKVDYPLLSDPGSRPSTPTACATPPTRGRRSRAFRTPRSM